MQEAKARWFSEPGEWVAGPLELDFRVAAARSSGARARAAPFTPSRRGTSQVLADASFPARSGSLGRVFDHVGIAVSDLAASERFYRTVLSVLGVEPSHADAELVEWDDWDIGPTDREHPLTRGLHVGFRARDRAQVDAFWQAGIDAGFRLQPARVGVAVQHQVRAMLEDRRRQAVAPQEGPDLRRLAVEGLGDRRVVQHPDARLGLQRAEGVLELQRLVDRHLHEILVELLAEGAQHAPAEPAAEALRAE
jgi:catechol 2,3-dioxygenase-like lactoylglutathione lyase family enzyme